jgi:hypothetical protein
MSPLRRTAQWRRERRDVVVKGRAEEIKNMYEVLLPWPSALPWHAGPKHRFVRIVPDDISGRRFRIVDPASWRTPYRCAACRRFVVDVFTAVGIRVRSAARCFRQRVDPPG